MASSESDRVLAPGVPLTLADGRTVTLRYGMRSLKEFEDRFGGLDVVPRLLNALIPDAPGQPPSNTKPVNTIVPVLAIGLREEKITEDDLLDGDLLDHRELTGAYWTAISSALEQAFPPPERPGKDEAAAGGASTGAPSTTPQPSSSDAAMASSGA